MIQSVKVKNLSLSKDNVRKRNREIGIETLAANIAAQGLLQNLIVTPATGRGIPIAWIARSGRNSATRPMPSRNCALK